MHRKILCEHLYSSNRRFALRMVRSDALKFSYDSAKTHSNSQRFLDILYYYWGDLGMAGKCAHVSPPTPNISLKKTPIAMEKVIIIVLGQREQKKG
jgi:hypothetical protein